VEKKTTCISARERETSAGLNVRRSEKPPLKKESKKQEGRGLWGKEGAANVKKT